MVNVRIHVQVYAGFDDEFWSCNAGFCSPTPSVSSPPILPPLAEQKSSLHRQNTLFTKDHSYKNFQPLFQKMKQIWKLRCQKMAIFSIITDFIFWGNFPQILAIFRQQKKYLNTILTLFLFFLSISLLSKAGENS